MTIGQRRGRLKTQVGPLWFGTVVSGAPAAGSGGRRWPGQPVGHANERSPGGSGFCQLACSNPGFSFFNSSFIFLK